MQLDMHYYSIYYLCLASGHNPENSYKIAYSSQYVDDARESRKIILEDLRGERRTFDPICTQHMSLQGFGEEVAEKVYFPFHFVPALHGDCPEEKTITLKFDENETLKKTFDTAFDSGDVFRIGIALHAFADSYSHKNFSGEWSTVNEIHRMKCVLRRRVMPSNIIISLCILIWEYLKRFLRWLFTRYAPEVGHLRAYKVPDYPHAVWRYRNFDWKSIKSSNPDNYINCGIEIFKQLRKLSLRERDPLYDEEVLLTLSRIIHTSGLKGRRIRNWRKHIKQLSEKEGFPTIPEEHYYYNSSRLWKQIAFDKKLKSKKEIRPKPGQYFKINRIFKDFKKSPLYCYHKAARQQRIHVLEFIEEELPRVFLSLEETRKKVILSDAL